MNQPVLKNSEPLSLRNPPRPETLDEVQFELIYYDVFTGDGEWHIYKLPDDVREFYDWSEFETVAKKIMSTSPFWQNPFKQSHTLDYLHNTHVLTLNLVTGAMFNPFTEELNRRTREGIQRGYRAPEGVPSGTIDPQDL